MWYLIRAIAFRVQVNRVIREERLHPFHYQPVQALQDADCPQRVDFCRWLLQKDHSDRNFLKKILWSDETIFTREGIFNQHNLHVYSHQNPHATRQMCFQQRWSVNVWAGILGDKIVDPYIIQETLTGQRYLVLLQDVLPDLLWSAGVSNQARRTIWFQQDGATAHFSKEVRQYLDQAFQVDGSDDVDPESGHRVLLIL